MTPPAPELPRRDGLPDGQARRPVPDEGELDSLRSLSESIRQYSLSKLPDLLEQLEANLTRNGVQVHWAETPDEANAIMLGIARRHQAKLIVKGKSMVSEEIEFNHAMEAAGVGALESDMGEYIVQLAGEKPSHIIMPAIHQTKQQIAKLFAEHIPGVDYTDNVDALIQIGRRVLREKFEIADIGLSGVNFAVAETGTLCLVENEGNGRMCTTVPKVHIAITGIEKVVEKLEHVAPLFSILTRSATGQAVSTYFNMISGPRRGDDRDGPEEVHLVLLDNGRSQAYADEQLRKTLQCIRCGACMNHCPVHPHRRPRLRHHLPRPHRQDRLAPHDGPRADPPAAHRLQPVRRLRRSLPGEDPHPRTADPPARRSPERPHANPAMVGQGAGYDAKISLLWKLWARLYARPATYRAFTWLATRFRSPEAAERLDRRPHAAETRSAKAEGHGQRPKIAPAAAWCRATSVARGRRLAACP
jgi:L-lactate dehydrogenase complex protein LldF